MAEVMRVRKARRDAAPVRALRRTGVRAGFRPTEAIVVRVSDAGSGRARTPERIETPDLAEPHPDR